MKKVITLTAGLFIASSAFASVQTSHSETTLFSPSYSSQAEAFDAGFDISDSLQAMSEHELRTKLPTLANNTVRNLALDHAQVTVEQFAVERGNIQYRAVVNVDYHFDVTENN